MKFPRQQMKKARIEIIPMIDTIFFLLVYFMITSLSMVQMSAHRVTLPISSTAKARPVDKVVVSISKMGQYYVDRQQVVLGQVLPMLTEKVKQNPNVIVVINCDKDQRLTLLLHVLDFAKQANPGTVMIATAPRTPDEARP